MRYCMRILAARWTAKAVDGGTCWPDACQCATAQAARQAAAPVEPRAGTQQVRIGSHAIHVATQMLHGYARGEVASLRAALKQRDAAAEHLHMTIAGLRKRVAPLEDELRWAQGMWWIRVSSTPPRLFPRATLPAPVRTARRAAAPGRHQQRA